MPTGNELKALLQLFPAANRPVLKKKFSSTDHLTHDSRQVKPGSVFIAVRGERTDGHKFISKIRDKAGVIIVNQNYKIPPGGKAFFIKVSNTSSFMQKLAPAFYGFPARNLKVCGITGTNGKTSVSYMLARAYRAAGFNPGIIGTIAVHYNGRSFPAVNTTPDICFLQQILYQMHKAGVDAVIMEVSSHALVLNRVQGIDFDSIIFTNLTPEHLDFHENMENYLNAKLTAFTLLQQSSKKKKQAAYWLQMTMAERVRSYLQKLSLKSVTFGYRTVRNPPDFNTAINRQVAHGQKLSFYHHNKKIFQGRINHVGSYNALNVTAALCDVYRFLSDPGKQINAVIQNINQAVIPGRLEPVPNNKKVQIIVDYAHSPDALYNALKVLKETATRRLICVFGCGGDRDKKKRPLMGKIAGQLADYTFLTSDNPRNEKPQAIIDDIIPGMAEVTDSYEVIPERAQAIARAVSSLKAGDILLIAGKGHEDYQIIGSRKIHFDDREIVSQCLS